MKKYNLIFNLSFLSYIFVIISINYIILNYIALTILVISIIYQILYIALIRKRENIELKQPLSKFFLYPLVSISIGTIIIGLKDFVTDSYYIIHAFFTIPLLILTLILLAIFRRKDLLKFCIVFIPIILIVIIFKFTQNALLVNYNSKFVDEYVKNNLKNCEIKEIKQYIYVPGLFVGGYKETSADNASKSYKKELYIIDHDLNIEYTLTFSHDKNEKIRLIENNREYYTNNLEKYQKNFENIKNVVEMFDCKVTNLGSYSEENIGQYILLMYCPNSDITRNVINEISDKATSYYATKKKTQDIIVNLPRYIICNNLDTYNFMKENCYKLNDLLYGKSYACKNYPLKETEEFLNLTTICDTLLDNQKQKYDVRTYIQQMYAFDESSEQEWICLYELELGVNYYTTLYKLHITEK